MFFFEKQNKRMLGDPFFVSAILHTRAWRRDTQASKAMMIAVPEPC
jgi:hypothetical protein